MRRALLFVSFTVGAALPVRAQTPGFEVAAIRLNTGPAYTMIGPGLRHGTLAGVMVTLRRTLAVAYGMTEPRVIGPDWLDKNRFDIAGKAPQGAPDTELKPMLQTLLRDRFGLVAHLETREMPVYFLLVAKGGAKMSTGSHPDGGPHAGADYARYRGFPMMRGTGTTSQLADGMTSFLGRPIIDKTGLKDRYNYFLSYAPLSPQAGDAAAPDFAPDLFTAIQKQLGLRLESGKDNVAVVVVDHVEQMPTEN